MIVAVIDAGLSRPRSSELMMAPILGEPFIWRMVERVRRARTLTRVMVATSLERTDDAVSGYLISRGTPVFRGQVGDVAGGYRKILLGAPQTSLLASLRADTPLIDPGVIDELVRYARSARTALATNTEPRTYPAGLDVEVFAPSAILDVAEEFEARLDPARYMLERPGDFETGAILALRDGANHDWTVRSPAAFTFVRGLFEALYPTDPVFGMEAVMDRLAPRAAGSAAA